MSNFKSEVDVQSLINDAWLGLKVKENQLFNPLASIPKEFEDEPHLYITFLMMQPEYFSFLCNEILNVKIHPLQALILKTMFTHKFPMLIMTRGGGKSFLLAVYCWIRALLLPGRKIVVVGSTFRQSKVIFEYMEKIWHNAPILRNICSYKGTYGPKHDVDMWRFYIGDSVVTAIPVGPTGDGVRGLRANDIVSDEFKCLRYNTLCETDKGLIRIQNLKDEKIINRYGTFENVIDKFISKNTKLYEIKTQYGYTIRCSANHRVLTTTGWKKTRDLTIDDYLVFQNNYQFPLKRIKINNRTLNKSLAWLFGFCVSEAALNSNYTVSITNCDLSKIRKCKKIIERLGFKAKIYKRKKYIDKRGWKCKKNYQLVINSYEFRQLLKDFGLEKSTSHNKIVPWSILQSPKDIVCSFLQGLFLGDGSCFTYECAKKTRLSCAFYSVSEQLVKDVHILLSKLDILGTKNSRTSKISTNLQHFIRINGTYSITLIELLNYGPWLNKINLIDKDSLRNPQYIRKYKNGNYKLEISNYNGKCISICRFKTYDEAQEYFENLQKMEPRGIKISEIKDMHISEDLYDLTTENTHSFYADGFIQHNSQDRNVFETVVAGFGAVSADPLENVQRIAAKRMAEKLGIKLLDTEQKQHVPNQLILSGTAYYQFNHFYEYYKRWKAIILSEGKREKFETFFGDGDLSESINYRDYCIIRIPIELMPEGFMDESQIARSKATMHSGNYQCEYGTVFSTDSNGFFKRSLIEACTVSEKTNIEFPSCGKVLFYPTLMGNRQLKYAIGIDPATEEDNFAISIIELHPDHRRIVYSWTITKKEQKARLDEGSISQNDFFTFCARKVRELMKVFPPAVIGIDSQGGGYALMEALLRVEEVGDKPIVEMIDFDDPKETDGMDALHLIKKVQFADAKWISEANNSLRLAFENKVLLFPHHDALTNEFARLSDVSNNKLYDTLEDCVHDIEELKDELSTIIMTSTESGRDKWTTPDKKEPGMKKGKMRKDRYTALLIANSVADFYLKSEMEPMQPILGGFAHSLSKTKDEFGGPEFIGPSWYVEQMKGLYD